MPGERKTRSARMPALPPEPAARNYGPRNIAGLLAPVLRPVFRRRAPAASSLLADWPHLAGPNLAAQASPVKFAGGTLTLACTGPVAMELQLAAPQLIAHLNLALGSAMVERLRFVQAAPRPPATPPAQPPRRDIAPPPGLPAGALGEALARLYQGLKTRG